jgi:hypothetical protein
MPKGRPVKILSIAYLVGLTWLLVMKAPFLFLGRQPGIGPLALSLEPVAHLASFALLTVLALWARWPIPRWALCLGLAGYGLGTELFQALLPWRTADPVDFLQDLGGIAAGGILAWLARIVCRQGKSVLAILAGKKRRQG